MLTWADQTGLCQAGWLLFHVVCVFNLPDSFVLHLWMTQQLPLLKKALSFCNRSHIMCLKGKVIELLPGGGPWVSCMVLCFISEHLTTTLSPADLRIFTNSGHGKTCPKPASLKTFPLRELLVKPNLRKHSRCKWNRNKSEKLTAAALSFYLTIGCSKQLQK